VKVLVTGGCGFLGGYAVWELVRGGHDVFILDATDQTANLEIAGDGRLPDTPIEVGDIRDLDRLIALIEGRRIQAVVHLAYLLLAPVRADPRRAVDVNCLGTANVFEAARRSGLGRLVWASSGGLMNGYVGTDVAVDDDTPPRPSDLYSFTKLLNEAVAAQYFETFGVSSIALRPVYINGLGLPSSAMGSAMLREAVINPVFGRPGVAPSPETSSPSSTSRSWQWPSASPWRLTCRLERAFTTSGPRPPSCWT
jgi:UDP-glucose 4-epimerase